MIDPQVSNDRSGALDSIDSSDLRAAKKRRASRLAGLPQSDQAPDAESGEDAGEVVTGRKLTRAQRAALIRVVAVHHYVDAVREVLAEEYPDFPVLTDRMIRYYRQQIDADMFGDVSVVRAQALRSGLANKAVRVRYMIRMVEQWRRVPLVESSRYFDEAGLEVTSYKTRADASREQRELLKQIALELGQLVPAAAAASNDLADDEAEALDADLRGDLNELLASMVERDKATEIALMAAVRPMERE